MNGRRPPDSAADHIAHLRALRVPAEPDVTLGFLPELFKREVAKPFRQLGDLTELWQTLLPERLVTQTRLESLQRGILTVAVRSSSTLYEVDRQLRDGLQTMLIQNHRGPAFRRIKLHVAPQHWREET